MNAARNRLDKRMNLVILAGGLGTRLSEETDARPNREAIKRMKKEQRKVFLELEDLLASTSLLGKTLQGESVIMSAREAIHAG